MSSPRQKRGNCGHAMAIFDGHAFCARCRERGKGEEPCISNKDTSDCKFCNMFTPVQHAQISTPSYKLKKEKREAKCLDNTTPTKDSSLVDPASVSVIGVVGESSTGQSPPLPPEKKTRKENPPTKSKKSASSSASDDRISALDQKWSEGFNRLEALIMAKSLEPTFSSDVRVTPAHSPPANMARDSEPFFQLPSRPVDTSSQRTGPDSCAAKQPSAGKLPPDSSVQGLSSSEPTGPDIIAAKQQSKSDPPRPKSSTSGRTAPDTAAYKHNSNSNSHTDPHRPATLPAQGTSKPVTDRPLTDRPLTDRPKPACFTGSDLPTLHKAARKDSISSLELEAESDFSDTPAVELFVEEGELSDEQEIAEQELPSRHTGKR